MGQSHRPMLRKINTKRVSGPLHFRINAMNFTLNLQKIFNSRQHGTTNRPGHKIGKAAREARALERKIIRDAYKARLNMIIGTVL